MDLWRYLTLWENFVWNVPQQKKKFFWVYEWEFFVFGKIFRFYHKGVESRGERRPSPSLQIKESSWKSWVVRNSGLTTDTALKTNSSTMLRALFNFGVFVWGWTPSLVEFVERIIVSRSPRAEVVAVCSAGAFEQKANPFAHATTTTLCKLREPRRKPICIKWATTYSRGGEKKFHSGGDDFIRGFGTRLLSTKEEITFPSAALTTTPAAAAAATQGNFNCALKDTKEEKKKSLASSLSQPQKCRRAFLPPPPLSPATLWEEPFSLAPIFLLHHASQLIRCVAWGISNGAKLTSFPVKRALPRSASRMDCTLQLAGGNYHR